MRLAMSEMNLQASNATVTDQALTGEDNQPPVLDDELEFDEELEDELIIEDFTIDGICGVY
jgi:mycofactocin precursor